MSKKLLQMAKRLTPYNLKKGFLYLKHYGPKEFWVRLTERMEEQTVDYAKWREGDFLTDKERQDQKKTEMEAAGENQRSGSGLPDTGKLPAADD